MSHKHTYIVNSAKIIETESNRHQLQKWVFPSYSNIHGWPFSSFPTFDFDSIVQLSNDIWRFTFNRLECTEPPINNLFDLFKLLVDRALSLYGLKFFWLRPEKPDEFFCADFESWFSRKAFDVILFFDELLVNGFRSPIEFPWLTLGSTLVFSDWLLFNERRSVDDVASLRRSFRIAYSSGPM